MKSRKSKKEIKINKKGDEIDYRVCYWHSRCRISIQIIFWAMSVVCYALLQRVLGRMTQAQASLG